MSGIPVRLKLAQYRVADLIGDQFVRNQSLFQHLIGYRYENLHVYSLLQSCIVNG